MHDLRFTLAEDHEQAFHQVAHSWFGDPSTAHVDAYMDLSQVDGYELAAASEGEAAKTLFFVNIGGYQEGVFNEEHRYLFLIGENEKEVKLRAVKLYKSELRLTHVDNTEEIDQVIPIHEIDGQELSWKATADNKKPVAHTGYWPLKKYQK